MTKKTDLYSLYQPLNIINIKYYQIIVMLHYKIC